jgi:hypothetical protein
MPVHWGGQICHDFVFSRCSLALVCRYISTPFVLEPEWRSSSAWDAAGLRMGLELLLQQYSTRHVLSFGIQLLEHTAEKYRQRAWCNTKPLPCSVMCLFGAESRIWKGIRLGSYSMSIGICGC